MYKRVRGTQDILPEASISWQEIEEKARRIFSIYGYQEIRVPILEKLSLFNRSLGETAEIVQKQMFEIKRDSDYLVLRPEGTASVVRAYIENSLDKKKDTSKLYYLGPMFRAERPQKGRLRQFHHIGVEAIGSFSPDIDIEIISLADRLVAELGIKNYQICLNSLGCLKDKASLADVLRKRLKDKLSEFCPDCQARFERNIFRVLDCKDSSCKKIISGLDIKQEYLCLDCLKHFERVLEGLDSINLKYKLVPSLVRGLDYYTRTVFEFKHSELGSQDALGAGGRYDSLVGQLGGSECGAVGFALGIERLLLVMSKEPQTKIQNLVYVIALGEKANKKAVQFLHILRNNGILADMDYMERSLKAKMRQANESGAKICLIMGEDELVKEEVSLKDMVSGKQEVVKQIDLIQEIKKRL